MSKQLIDTSGGDIVIQEKPITVTDEKLSSLLATTYERARKDARTFRLYNHYGVFFSIAGSLIIPLLTSTFKDFNNISGTTLTLFAWVIFGISLILGIILVIVRSSKQSTSELEERDKAVEEVLNRVINNKK